MLINDKVYSLSKNSIFIKPPISGQPLWNVLSELSRCAHRKTLFPRFRSSYKCYHGTFYLLLPFSYHIYLMFNEQASKYETTQDWSHGKCAYITGPKTRRVDFHFSNLKSVNPRFCVEILGSRTKLFTDWLVSQSLTPILFPKGGTFRILGLPNPSTRCLSWERTHVG